MIMIKLSVQKNKVYGDYRIEEYINGEWSNSYDGDWTKEQANKILLSYKKSYLNESILSNNS
jgi:hypothetical protein